MARGRVLQLCLQVLFPVVWKETAAVNIAAFLTAHKCISFPSVPPPSLLCPCLDQGVWRLRSAPACLCRAVLVMLVTVPFLVQQCHPSVVLQKCRGSSSSPSVLSCSRVWWFFSELVILLVTLCESSLCLLTFLLSLFTWLSSSPIISGASLPPPPNAGQHVISEAQRHAEAKVKSCKLPPFLYSAAVQFSWLFCSLSFLKFYCGLEY